MSRQNALHLDTPSAQEPKGDEQITPRAFQLHVGDAIPLVLTIAQLAGLLQISERTLLALRKAGTHRGIKQLDQPGDPRFDGRVFKAWFDGTLDVPARRHFFGQKRA